MITSPITLRNCRRKAFTLVEMLVAVAVLSLLIVLVTKLTNSAAQTTIVAGEHMDADQQAQMTFAFMEQDLNAMLKRKDVDCLFWKNPWPAAASANNGGNDVMYFYSEAPGFFGTTYANKSSSNTGGTPVDQSPVTFVGYHIQNLTGNASPINPNYALERTCRAMNWTYPNPTSPPSEHTMVLLTFGTSSSGVNPIPLSNSTIGGGVWKDQIGTFGTFGSPNCYYDNPPGAGTSSVTVWRHNISEYIFRLEFCFQLKDGTYSTKPMLSGTSNLPAGGGTPPSTNTLSSANTLQYPIGYRWWESSVGTASLPGQRGYIQTSATPGQPVWLPIGMRDVSSLVVAIAILDKNSRAMVKTDANGQIDPITMQNMIKYLPDPTDDNDPKTGLQQTSPNPPILMAKSWQDVLSNATAPTYATSTTLRQAAVSQIRVYQRTFPISQRTDLNQ